MKRGREKSVWLICTLLCLFLVTVPANLAWAANPVLYWPTDVSGHEISLPYGKIPGSKFYSTTPHDGIDIKAPDPTSLYAPFDGEAKYYQIINDDGYLVSYGNYCEITSKDPKFKNYKVRICHMSEFPEGIPMKKLASKVESGGNKKYIDKLDVHEGDVVGKSGGTGKSTGPHLHIVLIINDNKVDPALYFSREMSAKEHARKVTILGGNVTTYIGYTSGYAAKTNREGEEIYWESSKPSIVAVDSNGAYKALKKGKAVISAFLKDENGTKIKTSVDSRTIEVKEAIIKLKKKKLSLYPGQFYALKYEIKGNAPGKKVTWSTSKSTMASVSKSGMVSAKSPGICEITAKIGDSSDSCEVTVKQPAIKLNKTSVSLKEGAMYTLKATVKGSKEKVTWSSSDKSIAAVTSSGKVTGKKKGTATITAKVAGKTAKCKVTVKEVKISISISPRSKTIYTGKSFTIKATVKGTTKKVKWTSSNPKIAAVSTSGKVTGKKKGKATITAKVGKITAKCLVTVKEQPKQTTKSGGSGGCVTPDTLITLADGSQKRVDALKDSDILKVYDFDNGKVTTAPITLFHRVKEKEKVLRVEFKNGMSIGVVKDHCFFDLTDRRFVTIKSENQADQLKGHSFAILKGDSIEKAELTNIRLDGTTDSYYAPVSQVHLNCFTNGLLSMPGYVKGFCNVFELEEDELKYNFPKKKIDIMIASAISVALDAEEFTDIRNSDIFKKNKLDWIGVSVAKNMISIEELEALYEFCLPLYVNGQ